MAVKVTRHQRRKQFDLAIAELDKAIQEFDALGMNREADFLNQVAQTVTAEFVTGILKDALSEVS